MVWLCHFYVRTIEIQKDSLSCLATNKRPKLIHKTKVETLEKKLLVVLYYVKMHKKIIIIIHRMMCRNGTSKSVGWLYEHIKKLNY